LTSFDSDTFRRKPLCSQDLAEKSAPKGNGCNLPLPDKNARSAAQEVMPLLERQGRKQSERASQATRKSGHVHVSPRPYRYSRSRVRRLQLLIDSIQALGALLACNLTIGPHIHNAPAFGIEARNLLFRLSTHILSHGRMTSSHRAQDGAQHGGIAQSFAHQRFDGSIHGATLETARAAVRPMAPKRRRTTVVVASPVFAAAGAPSII
jgi:hypothetical protein